MIEEVSDDPSDGNVAVQMMMLKVEYNDDDNSNDMDDDNSDSDDDGNSDNDDDENSDDNDDNNNDGNNDDNDKDVAQGVG